MQCHHKHKPAFYWSDFSRLEPPTSPFSAKGCFYRFRQIVIFQVSIGLRKYKLKLIHLYKIIIMNVDRFNFVKNYIYDMIKIFPIIFSYMMFFVYRSLYDAHILRKYFI